MDHAGNMTYLNSQGLVFDGSAANKEQQQSALQIGRTKGEDYRSNVTDAMSGVEGVYYSADSADLGSGA